MNPGNYLIRVLGDLKTVLYLTGEIKVCCEIAGLTGGALTGIER